MACFTAAIAELAVVAVIKKRVEKKEKLMGVKEGKIALSVKLSWLMNLLWGGIFLLAIEHIWHGEIVPWFPFLTAMQNPQDTKMMLEEILTIGGCIDLFIPFVWFIACVFIDKMTFYKGLKCA